MSGPKPGFVAPAVAVLLAVLAGGIVLRAHLVRDLADASRSGAVVAARVLADGGAVGADHDVWTVREVPGPAAYPFLRGYVDAKTGRPLRPDTADKAIADLARRGGDEATPGGHRATARAADGRHFVVAVRRGSLPSVWLPLVLAGLVGWLLWAGALRRWGPGRSRAPAGAATSAALLLGTLLAVAPRAGTSLVAAAVLLPLVAFGVAGFITASRRSPHRTAYAYAGPAVAGLALLILVPFAIGVGLAFMRHTSGTFTWVGLDNFVSILASEGYALTHPLSFYYTTAVTVMWTGLNVFFHAAIGLSLAMVLNREDLRFRGVYRVLLIVPWAIPNYITALVWKGMFNKQYGLVNYVLGGVGVEPVGWFSSFWASFGANLATNTWLGFPFMMVVALGALQSIPKDLYEAASVDGASKWQQFRAITLPLLKPAMFPAIILGSIWTFNMFNIIYLVSGGQPNGATDILIVEAYRWAFEQDRYGYAAAYSVLIFVMLLGYSVVTSRVTKAAEGAYE